MLPAPTGGLQLPLACTCSLSAETDNSSSRVLICLSTEEQLQVFFGVFVGAVMFKNLVYVLFAYCCLRIDETLFTTYSSFKLF